MALQISVSHSLDKLLTAFKAQFSYCTLGIKIPNSQGCYYYKVR